MALMDDVYAKLMGSGVNCRIATLQGGSRMLGLLTPPQVPNAPLLFVICTDAASRIAFAGQCQDEVPTDAYWDTLAYVNAAIADTAIARMHVNDKNQILFTSSPILVHDGRISDSVVPAAMSFVLEACALSMGMTYIRESLMKPREAVAHVMSEMRRQAAAGLL